MGINLLLAIVTFSLWAVLADAGQKTITCTIMPRPWAHQCFDEYGTMVRHIKKDDGGWTFDYSIFDNFKIQMAGNRPPSEYAGIEVDNFSIDLDHVTDRYLTEAKARRKAGKITTVYSAGNTVCTSLKHTPEKIEWLGGYAGEHDLDGYLRWAFCSWPAHPNADAQFNPWFGKWTSGGTFLYYPEGPSVRYLALLNGINRTEKLLRMRRNIK